MLNLLKIAIGPILDGILQVIPDKKARAEAKEEFEGTLLNALTSLVEGQLRINEREAAHGSIFVAGWRPAIGWICGFALAWNFIFEPMGNWVAFMSGLKLDGVPKIELGPLLSILLGMLGLGGLRTYEKRTGVARREINNGHE